MITQKKARGFQNFYEPLFVALRQIAQEAILPISTAVFRASLPRNWQYGRRFLPANEKIEKNFISPLAMRGKIVYNMYKQTK
jgi:hypothetical protein